MKLKRILVPIDFSASSLAALDYAAELTTGFSPELLLLFVLEPVQFASAGHVYGSPTPINVESLIAEQRRLAQADLADLAARLTRRGVRARTAIGEGAPHRVIVDTASRLGADLIAMGTHGRTGLSRLFMGSVAEMVARHAGCPVLTVRGQDARGTRGKARGKARKGRRAGRPRSSRTK